MVIECCPAMLPHGRTALFHPPMQLPDQACGHSCAPNSSHGVAARNTSLDPINTILETFTQNLGEQLRKDRQAWHSWMSPSHHDPGGDPARKSLGSKPPLLEHLALGEGMATELELLASHMIHNINEHVKEKACKSKLRKGIKQEDPRGELSKSTSSATTSLHQQKNKQQRRTNADLTRQDCLASRSFKGWSFSKKKRSKQ